MKELLLLLLVGGVVCEFQQCCPKGDMIVGKRCRDSNQSVSLKCSAGMWLLKEIYLNGTKLMSLDAPNFIFVEDPKQYCLTETYRDERNISAGIVSAAAICYEPYVVQNNFEPTGILTLISSVFLVFTLAVYLYLPQMRDLQSLCYICLFISMALGYLSLGVLQLSPGFQGEICTITGFIVYFWMMATFFWMNVISINTYRLIDDPTHLKKTERTQFVRYNLYAWGSTVFFLFLALITDFSEGSHWKPGFGATSCWFQGVTETWIFFYGPIAILITSNVVLFVMSSWILWHQTRKYEVDKLNNLKHKFLLSLKLFLVMGISWVFEIASFAHGQTTIFWKIMDTFNGLQGVVIFVLLVLMRRRAMRGLASEGCCTRVTQPLAEKLSPHDDEDQCVLTDDTLEVRLN